jgi:hypothetical protein
MNKTGGNRDKFLRHVMKEFSFEGTRAAGVYYDEDLNAVMAVTGNEVTFEFREDIRAQPDKNAESWPEEIIK